ncbi:MAG: hypothetical protein ACI4SG_01440 [Oligosphaeraceae bacterium]
MKTMFLPPVLLAAALLSGCQKKTGAGGEMAARPALAVRIYLQYPRMLPESMIQEYFPLDKIITREELRLPSGRDGYPTCHIYNGKAGEELLRMDMVREPSEAPGETRLRIRLLENGRETILEDVVYRGEPFRRVWESDRVHLSLVSQSGR